MSFPLGYKRTKLFTNLKVAYTEPNINEILSKRLYSMLAVVPSGQEIIVFCVGTDRSTGDSLGPLVGSHLQKLKRSNFHLFGTLDEPVHAMNLSETLSTIKKQFHNPFIVAIDACLGQLSSVGCIHIADGPVKPGAGVNKELPPVGNIHITGIVNVGGFMEYFVLQNTRLSLVINMAEVIADSLHTSLMNARRVVATPSLTFK